MHSEISDKEDYFMKIDYLLLDVFTRVSLAGNPLAVVPKADGLLDNEMQAIARELNLSETVFIHKPQTERNTAHLRIFTPYEELPFAGHPTVGASVVLGMQKQLITLRLEEKIGVITALFEKIDKRSGFAKFSLPKLPQRLNDISNLSLVAETLGIAEDEIGCGDFKPAVFSAGLPFHFIPVRDAHVLKKAKPNMARFREAFPAEHHSAYLFTATPDERKIDYAARMFGMGVGEDPGTGSAAAALIGLLGEHVDFETGQVEYVLRQGYEIKRPCKIMLQIRKQDNAITHGSIGGEVVIMGQGSIEMER
jgi:trans-2,3-dihydro-3-hydroxyanthranilate isomerase